MFLRISIHFFAVLLSSLTIAQNEGTINFLLLMQDGQENVGEWFESIVVNQAELKVNLDVVLVKEDESDKTRICEKLKEGTALIVDLSLYENEMIKNVTDNVNVPYVKIDLSISPILNFLDVILDYRNSTDVAVIFGDGSYLNEAFYYWIGTPRLRLVISDKLDKTSASNLNKIRPTPQSYAIVSPTVHMKNILKVAIDENALSKPERWLLVYTDFNYAQFDQSALVDRAVHVLKLSPKMCCDILFMDAECECPKDFNLEHSFLNGLLKEIIKVMSDLVGKHDFNKGYDCDQRPEDLGVKNEVEELFMTTLPVQYKPMRFDSNKIMRIKTQGSVEIANGSNVNEVVGKYDSNLGFSVNTGKSMLPVRRFIRIGTTESVPWSFEMIDPSTGEKYWTGYCLDFAHKLGEVMDFDYEIVVPKNGTFGKKQPDGSWDGIVGDLASGAIDIAIAALTMTAEREEVIDFVAPYYEQSGISIVMRKPVRKTSLFKFMTVLKLEVWLSIVAALIVTGFMVWFLDKYSPYSARNNKQDYPYPCREFTLKESFWFALTSFTPQGGGEAPKALSGRTLVAAYWLFVVLMLATFTANLAAFLTVERMQTPVQSLEQLARQSRINYTVVEGSNTHQYFINMKFAEDTLYRLWKELTLNASTDDTRYRVWDYPIREQYGHILLAINDSMPVTTPAEGFSKVNERLDADFAFIHDSSEIKYEISRNCNLTEVGDLFAEKPYAVAVQQGSHLVDELSRNILDLQRERFFEYLQSKYWNHSVKGDCQADDTEGITLESLGGVFIATLFGLALAMLTLIGEVIYYKKRSVTPKNDKKPLEAFGKKELPKKQIPSQITIGSTFKPVKGYNPHRVSPTITLYPKARSRISRIN